MDYFIYTGASYQVRNLLLDLLKHNRYYFENDIPDDERVKMYIKDDDIKYSMLAKLIMGKCICVYIFKIMKVILLLLS